MITPKNKNILIKPIEDTITETESGLVLPSIVEGEESAMAKGEVVATDSDIVNTGDIILFSKFIPLDIEVDKQKYIILKEDGVLAVIN